MFIPLRTDCHLRRRPVITETLIFVNVLVYLVGAAGAYFGWFEIGDMLNFGHFYPREFRIWQLFTYQFLHDPSSIWHLAFNMLFLWVFGAAVEDRLGHLGFLGFYLVGGAAAGLGHAMFEASPVIGASGSIAAVTGGFLALFPRSRIKVLFFFFFIGIFLIPSLWFVGIYITLDVLRQIGSVLGRDGSNVAYMAHIAGYVYGFGTCLVLLATKLLPRGEFDVFRLFQLWRRRAALRAANRASPAGPWDSATADTGKRLAKQRERKPELSPEADQIVRLRAHITECLTRHDIEAAAAAYRLALAKDPSIVFPEERQLELANQLFAGGHDEEAARAYELFLERYGSSHRAAEVRLLLGLLYARRLSRPDRARELITTAQPRLTDEGHRELAAELLAELGA